MYVNSIKLVIKNALFLSSKTTFLEPASSKASVNIKALFILRYFAGGSCSFLNRCFRITSHLRASKLASAILRNEDAGCIRSSSVVRAWSSRLNFDLVNRFLLLSQQLGELACNTH